MSKKKIKKLRKSLEQLTKLLATLVAVATLTHELLEKILKIVNLF